MKLHWSVRVFLLLVLASLLSGCGGGGESFDVAPVRGVLTVEGEPVDSGMVQVTPIKSGEGKNPGKSGIGEIQPGGAFVITTYKTGDGAVVGPATITAGSTNPDEPWKRNLKTPVQVEVQPGENNFQIDIQADGTASVQNAADN